MAQVMKPALRFQLLTWLMFDFCLRPVDAKFDPQSETELKDRIVASGKEFDGRICIGFIWKNLRRILP